MPQSFMLINPIFREKGIIKARIDEVRLACYPFFKYHLSLEVQGEANAFL